MLVLLVSCISGCSGGGGAASVPPCNAWIFLFGAADLTLDCPAANAIPLLERNVAKPP